jgi:hypothetical protein
MQNEIIGISGDMICEKIVTACNNSEYFALIGDEATDVLTHEQVSVHKITFVFDMPPNCNILTTSLC